MKSDHDHKRHLRKGHGSFRKQSSSSSVVKHVSSRRLGESSSSFSVSRGRDHSGKHSKDERRRADASTRSSRSISATSKQRRHRSKSRTSNRDRQERHDLPPLEPMMDSSAKSLSSRTNSGESRPVKSILKSSQRTRSKSRERSSRRQLGPRNKKMSDGTNLSQSLSILTMHSNYNEPAASWDMQSKGSVRPGRRATNRRRSKMAKSISERHVEMFLSHHNDGIPTASRKRADDKMEALEFDPFNVHNDPFLPDNNESKHDDAEDVSNGVLEAEGEGHEGGDGDVKKKSKRTSVMKMPRWLRSSKVPNHMHALEDANGSFELRD